MSGGPSFDPSVLSNLTTLRNFSVAANGITDLTPFAGLTNAYQMGFSENSISDLSPLAPMGYRTDLGTFTCER